MKPSFALNITDTSIGLLHRTARGWLQVGETAFDTADLAEALGYLRGSALGLSPGGLTTKLVLPNSQIKYLELDAPGPTDADRRTQIRAELVGRTPYNVEDLVFDWSGTGQKVQVAVVARETLDEAEAFAAEHRFNPVSFVGIPAVTDFKGEPWFGPTKLSTSLLEKSEKVDRDAEAVQVTARDLPKSQPVAAKSAAESSGDTDETTAKPATEADKPTRAQRRAAAAAAAEQARAAETAVAPDQAAPVEMGAGEAAASDAAPIVAAEADAFPEIIMERAESAPTWPEVVPEVAPRHEEPAPTVVEAEPVAAPSVTDSLAFPEMSANDTALIDPAGGKDDLPPAPAAAIMAAFASRRAPDIPSAKRYGSPTSDATTMRASSVGGSDLADRLAGKSTPPPLSRPKVGADPDPTAAVQRTEVSADPAAPALETAVAKSALVKPTTAFVTAPSIPGSRKRKSLPPEAAALQSSADTRKSLTKPGGTFASAKGRGKPRYLGLILTGLLLLFLALIAAWSSFVVSSDEATQTDTTVASVPQTPEPVAQATTEAPAVDDEMLADSQDPDAFDGLNDAAAEATVDPSADLTTDIAIPEAADAGQDAPLDVAPDAAVNDTTVSAANAPSAAAPEPAPVGVAGTDSPNAAPLSEAQDEIFLTAIDAPPLALDPLALPAPVASKDALPLPQLEPPPFGTVYQFDADGRIRPTPEGIITPEGVRLVAGKPSLIPPPRPDDLIAALGAATAPAASAGAIAPLVPGATETAAVPFPSDPALAEARPRPRPADLAAPASEQADDDASLEAPGASRVASLRPQPRPAAVLAAGEAARQSTAAASLAAQAEQTAAVEAAVQASFQPDANTSPLAVRVSRKPAARPKDMTRAVEAAVAVAVRSPEPSIQDVQPEADQEPETASAAPAIPTRASVAKQATYVNAINLSKINLIGVYGSKSNPYALIRQANGRYKKVKVGDTIDGGRVAAIGASEVRYLKSGRMISLKLPKT